MGNFTYDFDILVVVYENLRDNFNYASVFKISTKADGEEDEIFQLSVIGKDFCLATSSETTVVSMNAKYCCGDDSLIIVKIDQLAMFNFAIDFSSHGKRGIIIFIWFV